MEGFIFAGLIVAIVSVALAHVRLSRQEAKHRELVTQIQWILDTGTIGPTPEPKVEGDLLWEQSADWVNASRANRGW